MTIQPFPATSFLALCNNSQDAARAIENTSPYYGAIVLTPEIAALHERLVALHSRFPENLQSLHFDGDFQRDTRDTRIGDSIPDDVLAEATSLLSIWCDIVRPIHDIDELVLRNTQNNRGLQRPHCDDRFVSLLSAGPTTRLHISKAFNSYRCHDLSVEDCTLSPPLGHALIMGIKEIDGELYSLGHCAPLGPRLTVMASG